MPSGFLISNLNVAVKLGNNLHRSVVNVKLSPPVSLITRKNSIAVISGYSSKKCGIRAMVSSGSIVASGDVVVDKLVTSCGGFSGFVKPSAVFYNDRSYRNCRQGRVSLRIGESDGFLGAQGSHVFDCKGKSGYSTGFRSFSTSPDGIAPEVSIDEASIADELSSLAISPEKTLNSKILKLNSGVCYMPHPAKVEKGGEDAHFVCADEQVIGVADGVGGWADHGIDAGLYAKELMSNSVKAIREVRKSDINPLHVLEKAHAATKALGSSTACIIALKEQKLHAINLGDSGFIVVRDGRLIFESPVQQHSFNFTYQLENSERADLPSSGQVFEIPVGTGDVIVAGSDGLFDNLFNKEVAEIVGEAFKKGLTPDAMAQKIAKVARARALDRKTRSPFAVAAQEAGYTFYGGKLDDLTVVVSYVST